MTYQAAPATVALHVWRIDAGAAQAADVLSPDERCRAARMTVADAAARFTAARAGLRLILGAALDRDPAGLRFTLGPHGKPAIADDPGFGFNLSHSGDLAALACARGLAIGLDIERIRPFTPGLPERFFAASEARALQDLPAPARTAAFHACWTRKEAVIKALGTGLSTRLDSFAVSLAPAAPAALLWMQNDCDAPARWQLHDFAPAPGYAGALAVPARGWRVRPMPVPWQAHEADRASR